MGLLSKLGAKNKGIFFFALFYLMVGVLNFVILGVYGQNLFHVALIAVLSLIAAFGLYRLQNWTLWLVVAIFFIATTHIAFMLNAFWTIYVTHPDISNLFAVFAWVIYLILTWIATLYIAAKRKSLT